MDFIVPDNFINFENIKTTNIDYEREADALLSVLDSASKENDVQQYIKQNQKWFIPISLLKDYDFGHHSAYLIPEQSLGSEYRVDYMLLGNNSIGHQIVLVEFEDVNVEYRLKSSNSESVAVRKGLTQIRDWKRWMDDNRVYFLKSCGLSKIINNIPSWGIHYCLVVSRRNKMDEISNQMRGQTQHESPELHIVSYDRLIDNVRNLVNGI